jgi:hypothetical protein
MNKKIEIFSKHIGAGLPVSLAGSVLDAGSPQYVLPEDQFLDIQSQLFGIPRSKDGIDPLNFGLRWRELAPPELKLKRFGAVSDDRLATAVDHLLKGPQSKKQSFRTALPLVPAVGFYKSLSPKRPNFFKDQFQPALFFADPLVYPDRIKEFKHKLASATIREDTVRQAAEALIPVPSSSLIQLDAVSFTPRSYSGPLLRNFSLAPSEPLSVFSGLALGFDAMLKLEDRLPRLIWIRWINALLRLWLPLAYLRRCQVTTSASQEVLSAIASGAAPLHTELSSRLCDQQPLLRGSNEALNQLTPQIQSFIRSRFELSIIVQLSNVAESLDSQGIDLLDSAQEERAAKFLQPYMKVDAQGELVNHLNDLPGPDKDYIGSLWRKGSRRLISMPNDNGDGHIALNEWIDWLVTNSDRMNKLSKIFGADNLNDLVERVYANLRPEYEPLKNNFGKNAFEYVAFNLGITQKKDRDHSFPDEYNFIERKGRRRTAKHIAIAPGSQLLAMMVQIVSSRAKWQHQASAKLSDLLDLFEMGGIDFRSNPEDFEFLKHNLLELGLLRSSADAAEAASLNPPYSI